MKLKNRLPVFLAAACLLMTGCTNSSTSDAGSKNAETETVSEAEKSDSETANSNTETETGSETAESITESETEANSQSAAQMSTSEDENVVIYEKTTGEVPSISGEIFAMDTYMTITCYGDQCEEALNDALAEIQRLDELLSTGNSESEISLINQNGTGNVSEDTETLVKTALDVYEDTEGAFDITIYPLMAEWGFTTGDFQVPSDQRIKELVENIDASRLELDTKEHTLTIGENQGIDLGGIAKGYTSDRLMEIFAEHDLTAAVLSLGGNVQCYKTKPDGSLWRCGIVDPNDPDSQSSFLGIVELDGQAAITSGAYERNFTDPDTGKTYHHIIDPETGYPAESGIISATVVSKNGILADALSTAVYVKGLDWSINYWSENSDDFDLILMTDENKIYVTGGIKDRFTSDYPVTVVE